MRVFVERFSTTQLSLLINIMEQANEEVEFVCKCPQNVVLIFQGYMEIEDPIFQNRQPSHNTFDCAVRLSHPTHSAYHPGHYAQPYRSQQTCASLQVLTCDEDPLFLQIQPYK